jgi:hypothetical protein
MLKDAIRKLLPGKETSCELFRQVVGRVALAGTRSAPIQKMTAPMTKQPAAQRHFAENLGGDFP